MADKFRTLIVDDDELVLELMKHVARRQPHLAVEATTEAARAMEWIRTRDLPFHIIISDLVMPHFTGIDVLRTARTRSPDTLGIIVTGFGDQQSTAEAIKLGVSHYLRKPFRREELELVFRNATAHFQMRGKLAEVEAKHALVKEDTNSRNQRLESLEKEASELRTRMTEFLEQEKEKTRLEDALSKARSAPRSDVRQFAVMRQLNDLGQLYQHRQISDGEFHSMRKSLLDKAYKSIL